MESNALESSNNSPATDNESLIHKLYEVDEVPDSSGFAALFADDGCFCDVSAGAKYFGSDIGKTVDIYATAFPDMHRELEALYVTGQHCGRGAFIERNAPRPTFFGGRRHSRVWQQEAHALLRRLSRQEREGAVISLLYRCDNSVRPAWGTRKPRWGANGQGEHRRIGRGCSTVRGA